MLGQFQIEDASAVPVDDHDPRWGSEVAPVTIVVFVDFQCAACADAHRTLHALMHSYGRDRLRIVWKHFPLASHGDARRAALAAQAVRDMASDEAFLVFADGLFAAQRSLDDATLIRLAEEVGLGREPFLGALSSEKVRQEVDASAQRGTELGIDGTPSFRVNGLRLEGAAAEEQFRALIDAELRATSTLTADGVPPREVYARRVATNFESVPAETPPRTEPQTRAPAAAIDESLPRKVPIAGSPVRGSSRALVTIVEFSDFQCPFCARAHQTLDELLHRYPTTLRLVFKYRPLAFHDRALPAAQLAAEAMAERGNAGFWRAADLLFQSAPALADGDLLAIARTLKLDEARAQAAIVSRTPAGTVSGDVRLADDVGAQGTPYFFVNGRRQMGALPLEDFVTLVEEELARAKQLMRARHLRPEQVYDELQKSAR